MGGEVAIFAMVHMPESGTSGWGGVSRVRERGLDVERHVACYTVHRSGVRLLC